MLAAADSAGCCFRRGPSSRRRNAVPLLEGKVVENPADVFAWTRLAGLYLDEMRGTGDLAFLAKAQHAAEMATRDVDARFSPGGLAARGQVELAAHQFTAARATALEYCEVRGERSTGWQLLGDAEFELGNYPEAEKAFAKMEQIDDEPSVAALHPPREAGAGAWAAREGPGAPGGGARAAAKARRASAARGGVVPRAVG